MSYKFNNGRGAVICDDCGVMLDAYISYKEYTDIYGINENYCWRCINNKKHKVIEKVLKKPRRIIKN